MRHIGKWAGAALIALTATAAFAQTGAPAGAPMQPGGWGQGGWQAGAPGAGYAAAPQRYASQPQDGFAPGPHAHADYRRLERGKRVPHAYTDQSYTVHDWRDWGFAPPGPGLRWVRYYDDGLLIDPDGRIVDARYGVDWDRGARRGPRDHYAGGPGGYPSGYAGGAGYAYPGPGGYPAPYAGGAYPAPGVTTFRAGPNTVVTTAVVQAPPPVIVGAPVYGYAGGASVISVTPGVAVTTTTTTTDYETVYRSVGVRRAWKRPIRHYHPRCVRAATCAVQGS